MKLTWLGHACFVLEHEDYRIVADPYLRVEGYPHMRAQAHAYTCSHQHLDHYGPERVELLPETKSPFTIRTVETCHDDKGGTLRGKNTIHIYSAGGMNVAHLGDLGHQLSAGQVASIGPLDAVMVPVGGFYTLDAAGAKAVCEALGARIVVPMHYRHAPHGLSNVGGVEEFLALWEEQDVHRVGGNTIEVTADKRGVWVPTYVKPR
ncbi:MAG: MBL fold metallo-hydrolase [Oscillibacter sp.]|nr:MBL fold metallo-hydrolase [Oscillibacter sp.]